MQKNRRCKEMAYAHAVMKITHIQHSKIFFRKLYSRILKKKFGFETLNSNIIANNSKYSIDCSSQTATAMPPKITCWKKFTYERREP